LTWNLILAGALWVIVVAVAVANRVQREVLAGDRT
jgi:hypothetical protein